MDSPDSVFERITKEAHARGCNCHLTQQEAAVRGMSCLRNRHLGRKVMRHQIHPYLDQRCLDLRLRMRNEYLDACTAAARVIAGLAC